MRNLYAWRLLFIGVLISIATVSATAQPILSLDFDERGGALTYPGFTSFLIDSVGTATAIQTNPTVRTVGAFTVTLSGLGANNGYDDRLRGTPTNSGALTTGDIYRDFVFSRDNTGNGGLDLRVAGLTPNGQYQVSVWSFDSGSPGTRVSDWSANGTVVRSDYTFGGAALPTTDDQYKFTFDASANGIGELLISGRRDSTSVNATATPDFGVFLNAIRIEAVPEPGSLSLLAGGICLAGLYRGFSRKAR
jgi:hypothetical protein